MKTRLLTSVAVGALAAAAPAMAQPPTPAPPVPIYNWTGFYGGLNVGWSWGNGAVTYNEPAFAAVGQPSSISSPSFLDGLIGGFQAGYNWQLNTTWVTGLEADIQWASEVGNGSFSIPIDGEGRRINGTLGSQILWFGTVRGRVGWLYTPQILVYATGGLAYGKVDAFGNFTANFGINRQWGFNQSPINTGWTVGGGVEGVVQTLPNVTWKAEYLYVDLGSVSGSGFDSFGNPYSYNAKFTDNIFRVGLSWHNF